MLVASGAGGRDATLALVGGPSLLRAAIAGLIDAQPGLCVACSFSSIDAVAEACRLAPPPCDVLVLDVDDHRGACTDAVDHLLGLELDCKLVLLCTAVSPEVVFCASTRRVDGVLLKESSVRELREAVAHIVTGHAVMPARWRAMPAQVELTARQGEVLELVALGYSNEEIADRLGLRPNTVKFHISEIFRRLGVRNRIEAATRLSELERGSRAAS
jgi:DNA-binding NarL/FixJ family response regulator